MRNAIAWLVVFGIPVGMLGSLMFMRRRAKTRSR